MLTSRQIKLIRKEKESKPNQLCKIWSTKELVFMEVTEPFSSDPNKSSSWPNKPLKPLPTSEKTKNLKNFKQVNKCHKMRKNAF